MTTTRRRRLRSLTFLAVLAVALGVTTVPGPARADDVSAAQARVDALQEVARESTERLVAGTRAWEADQVRLRAVRLALANTTRRVQAAQAELGERQERVSAVGRQLYMQPVAPQLQLAFTHGPDDVLEALQVRQSLEVGAGSEAQLIAQAATAQHRLRNEEANAARLVDEASRLTAASAERLADLKALAARTSAQLQEAQTRLERALVAREAAREAARAKAARDKAAQERASRLRTFSGGATCSGKPTSGQSNGNLDPASLCPLWMADGHRLRSDAAAGFNAMSKHHAATQGSPLCVTDSYRSYSEQAALYQSKPGLAAVPGSSNHGWGLAVDLCGGVQDSGSAAYRWMKENAGRFGWSHPEWAEPSGSRPEPWHWEFNG